MRLRMLLLAAVLLAAGFAHGQTYADLHDFGASSTSGSEPQAGVSFDSVGNMYGTTWGGGAYGANGYGSGGTIWEITRDGAFKGLHDFGKGSDGDTPDGGVTLDAAGNIYGTTLYGGAYGVGQGDYGDGIVWEITKAGVYKVLHNFGDRFDGQEPCSGVSFDAAGNMYGTTGNGGLSESGMVWEITTAGAYEDLHDFGDGSDGVGPVAGVSFDDAGNMYGTASLGGAYGDGNAGNGGMVWEITKSGIYKDLHDFGNGTDGYTPCAGVTADAKGNIYGTTYFGGVYDTYGSGMIWEITKAGAYKDLHDFGSGLDGYFPQAGVSFDAAGNMYGTTYSGGVNGPGIVWEISAAGVYRDIHDFGIVGDGIQPLAGVTIDTSGNLFGTTSFGGLDGGGMVWLVARSALAEVSVSPSFVTGSTTSKGTVTLSTIAPIGGFSVSLAVNAASATTPSAVTIPAGETSATFTVSTVKVSNEVQATITGTLGSVSKTGMLTIYPPPVSSVSVSPNSGTGGTLSTGTVTIVSAAPTGGVPINLSSSSPDATVPSAVTVAAGATSATFTVKTLAVASNVTATISATDGQVTKTATVTVEAPVVTSVSLSPTTVIGGTSSNCTVTISGPAPSGGFALDLSSSSPSAGVPGSVTIPAGKTSVTFPITTKPVSTNTSATITIKAGSVTKTAALTIDAAVLTKFTVNPPSIAGAGTVTGTLTLSGPAPTGGASIKVTSNSSYATVPSPVVISSGSSTANFTIKIMKPPTTVTATLTATFGGVSKAAMLKINP